MIASNISYSASFNCKSKLNTIENMICANKKLSSLDDTLGALYKYIIVSSAEKKAQINWIKNRNKCKDVSCIEKSYLSRIDDLSDYRIPIKSCLTSTKALSEYADKEADSGFHIDRKVDLNGNGLNEIIYNAGGCNVHCEYMVYEKINGCYFEKASFSAREYFIMSPTNSDIDNYLDKNELAKYIKDGDISNKSFKCLFINNHEPGDGSKGITYQPWCFDKK